MNEYCPDNWIVFKAPDCYKVLAGWSGGYLDPDTWQVNSGIVSVTQDDEYLYFKGFSDSVYKCHKNAHGIKNNNAHVWEQLKEECEILPENTDWSNFNWSIE